jgi:hypothetical protein
MIGIDDEFEAFMYLTYISLIEVEAFLREALERLSVLNLVTVAWRARPVLQHLSHSPLSYECDSRCS